MIERLRALFRGGSPERPAEAEAPDLDVELAPFEGPLRRLPENRPDVYRFFGNPGVGDVDPAWERPNMVRARNLPGSWNGGRPRLYVHRLAEPYLREALRRCVLLDCIEDIETIGGWNFRHQRHDPRRPLSYHSWGIAVDINSEHNGGWYIDDPPAPWSDAWRLHYPLGVSPELVRAFESTGWHWGGRWKRYVDPMHMCLTNG